MSSFENSINVTGIQTGASYILNNSFVELFAFFFLFAVKKIMAVISGRGLIQKKYAKKYSETGRGFFIAEEQFPVSDNIRFLSFYPLTTKCNSCFNIKAKIGIIVFRVATLVSCVCDVRWIQFVLTVV